LWEFFSIERHLHFFRQVD